MSEHEEKNVDNLQEVAQVETPQNKNETAEMSLGEKMELLQLKCDKLEQVANYFKKNIPNILQIGRPIQLNLINKGFIYQFIIPEHALSSLDQFSDVHTMMSKFSALLLQMEENAKKAIQEKVDQKGN